MVLKSRKVGISTWEQAESYFVCAEEPYRQAVTLADNAQNTQKIFEIAEIFMRNAWGRALPPGSEFVENVLRYHDGTSEFYVGTAGSKTFARGATLQRGHGSEVAHWPGNDRHQKTLIAGLQGACEFGELVLETTANGTKGWFYNEAMDALRGDSEYTLIFIPWWWDDKSFLVLPEEMARETMAGLTDEERHLVELHELTAGQIVFRRRMQATYKDLFSQEYPETPHAAFLSTGRTFFDAEVIRKLIPHCKAPVRKEIGGKLTIWKEPDRSRRYVAGVDSASGVPGKDWCAMGVLDWETGEQVARLYGHWAPYNFARHIAQLGAMYSFPLLGVERENMGWAVLEALVNVERYPDDRLYYHSSWDPRSQKESEKLGWTTNKETRPILLDSLSKALTEGGMRCHDRELLAECLVFESNEQGRFEAASGEHDDLIFAWGIANRMRLVRHREPGIL